MYYDSVFDNVNGHEMVSQCIKIWNRVSWALCDNFQHCELFFRIFGPPAPAPDNHSAAGYNCSLPQNFYAGGYCFDLMHCEKVLQQRIRRELSSG